MRYLLTVLLCLFLAAPAFAQEGGISNQRFFLEGSPPQEQDSLQKIVRDYRFIEDVFKSGQMNQVDHRKLLIELQKRAQKKIEEDCFDRLVVNSDGKTLAIKANQKIPKGYKVRTDIVTDGGEKAEGPYCLEGPYKDPDYPLFLKIASGFLREPS